MTWTSTATASPYYNSTRVASTTVTETLVTYAPNPGTSGQGHSCAKTKDSRTGVTYPMTYQSSSGGQNPQFTWSYSLSLTQGTAEGNWTLTGWVEDCGLGTHIDNGTTASYLVDNTIPSLYAYAPQDAGNCVMPCRNYFVMVRDAGAGLDQNSARLTVSLNGVPVISNVTPTVTYSQGTYRGFSYTGPVLLANNDYVGSFSINDLAGNPLAFTYAFKTMTFTVGVAQVSIPSVAGTLQQSGSQQLVSFANVALNVGPFNVVVSGSKHAGSGTALQTAVLDSATVSYALSDGTTLTVPANTLPTPQINPFEPRDVFEEIALPDVTSTTIAQAPVARSLGLLKVYLPGNAVSATLSMSSTPADITSHAGSIGPGIPPINPMGPCDPDDPCAPPPTVPQVDPFLIFTDTSSAEAIVEAVADSTQSASDEVVADTGTNLVTLLRYDEHIITCSSDDGGASLRQCSDVTGTRIVPDPQGECHHTACVGDGDDNVFIPQDYSTCGTELPCSLPEGPTRPKAQANNDCQVTQTGYAECKNSQWLSVGAHRYQFQDPTGSDGNPVWHCKGDIADTPPYHSQCEAVITVIAEGGPGYDNNPHGSGGQAHQAWDGIEGGFKHPDSNNELIYGNWNSGGVREHVLDWYTYSGGGCDPSQHPTGYSELHGISAHTGYPSNGTYPSDGAVVATGQFKENLLRYPNGPYPYGCWTNRYNAWAQSKNILLTPILVANPNDPSCDCWRVARMSFQQAWSDCSWGFTGVSFGPGFSLNIGQNCSSYLSPPFAMTSEYNDSISNS